MAIAKHSEKVPYHQTRGAIALERRREAFKLLRHGHTQMDIAERLGVTHQAVSQMIRQTMVEIRDEEIGKDARDYRDLELKRLDKILEVIGPQADAGDHAAIQRVMAIMERRAKLLGLDAPTKVEVTEGIAEELKKARERVAARKREIQK